VPQVRKIHLRLRPDAAALFPQLQSQAVVLRQNGEYGFEIPTVDLPEITRAFTCEIDHVVFLNRAAGGSTQIGPLPKDFARKWMENVMDFTFTCTPNAKGNRTEMFLADPKGREEQNASLDGLLGGGIHELCYSDLDSAIDCLESLVGK
jgi:hypothetical protein